MVPWYHGGALGGVVAWWHGSMVLWWHGTMVVSRVTQFQPGHRMSKLGKQNFWVVTSFFASEQCYFYSVVNILLTEFRQNIEYEHCTARVTWKMEVTIVRQNIYPAGSRYVQNRPK